jgi:hypothetical protein
MNWFGPREQCGCCSCDSWICNCDENRPDMDIFMALDVTLLEPSIVSYGTDETCTDVFYTVNLEESFSLSFTALKFCATGFPPVQTITDRKDYITGELWGSPYTLDLLLKQGAGFRLGRLVLQTNFLIVYLNRDNIGEPNEQINLCDNNSQAGNQAGLYAFGKLPTESCSVEERLIKMASVDWTLTCNFT